VEPLPLIAVKLVTLVPLIAWVLRQDPEADIAAYLRIQWGGTLAIYGVLLCVPKSEYAFYAVYIPVSAAILLSACWITLRAILGEGREGRLILLGCAFGGAMLYGSLHSIPRPEYLVDWVHIVEGSVLIALAVVLGVATRRAVAFGLAFSWLAHGVFRLLFRLHWNDAAWNRANVVVPWLIVLCTVGWIGAQLSRREQPAVGARTTPRSR
jgi:hypothetical protein